VRNLEDGTCRVRQARAKRILSITSLKGRQTPGGELAFDGAAFGPNQRTLTGGKAEALGGQPSLREPSERLRLGRPLDGTPRSRGNGKEGATKSK